MNAPAQPPPPPTPDTKAAHEFLTELTTRIATQRLPYRDGDEQTALESLASLFPKGRAIIHANPGCTTAKAEIEAILNNVLRPFTAKWHRQSIEGRLAGRDGADAFREELLDVQDKARESAAKLAGIAAGDPDRPVNLPWPSEEPSDLAKRLDKDMEPLRCGIPEQMAGLPDLLSRGEPTQKKAPYGTAGRGDINRAEAHAIRDRRKNVGASRQVADDETPHDAFGLAFSGGGIRSASFALGVAQALGEKGLLKEADYVSTVSGGGYTGSFITRRLGAVKPQTSPADPSRGVIDKPKGPDTPAISYLRMRAGYLSGDGFKRRWLMACHMISGTLLNWMAPLLLLLLPAFFLSLLVVIFDFEFNVGDASDTCPMGPSLWDWAKHWWATKPMVDKVRDCNRVLILGLALAGTLLYGVKLRFCASSKKALSGVVQGTGVLFGLSVSLGLAYLLLDVLDGHGLNDAKDTSLMAGDSWLESLWDKAHAVVGSAAGAGTLGVVAHALGNAKVRKALAILGIGLAILIVPFTALVIERSMLELAVHPRADANRRGDDSPSADNKPHGNPWIPIGATVVVFVGVLVALDVNRTSPRPLYQERLARTFIKFNEDDDEIPLETANPSGLAPIHILNSALNLPGTTAATMRERGCDFFSFTPFYCGAPTIGYEETSKWKSHGQSVSLDVAMAVSAAAASSRMGLFAVPGAAPLMTLLNVRLGYWLRKPWQPGCIKVPGAMQLTSEMTGWRMDERAEWINLSDGGHIENMAAYELLRRRCKFILCVDGEADGDFGFGGLMTLVRHARIDMGIDMQPMLNELRPKQKGGPSRSHFAMWKIHYPNPAGPEPGPAGFFLYLKLSMTGNEPELIRTYQQKHPDFPHQSTADQFFNQEQFEAYRSLGAHVTEMLFQPALLRAPGDHGGNPQVQNVRDFYRRIARNMLY